MLRQAESKLKNRSLCSRITLQVKRTNSTLEKSRVTRIAGDFRSSFWSCSTVVFLWTSVPSNDVSWVNAYSVDELFGNMYPSSTSCGT